MRWYFTAAVALFALTTLLQSTDSKSAKAGDIEKAGIATKEKKENVLKEAALLDEVEKKLAGTGDKTSLIQNSEPAAASKQGEVRNANPNSETEPQREQDPHRGRYKNKFRKNKYRQRKSRRHRNRYRAYKRKFHNQRDYYYLKKIIDPDSGMVQDVATLDDIITLDDADDDLPKKRKKRNANIQDDHGSCSDSDSDDD